MIPENKIKVIGGSIFWAIMFAFNLIAVVIILFYLIIATFVIAYIGALANVSVIALTIFSALIIFCYVIISYEFLQNNFLKMHGGEFILVEFGKQDINKLQQEVKKNGRKTITRKKANTT